MYAPKRIIHLARDRALSSFTALSEQTVVEADTSATRAMLDASGTHLDDLHTVRSFLRGDARTLRTRMDRHFAGLLERALETMHVDSRRPATQEIDYRHLALIDDDVIVRQIELDRMVARLREAEPLALGRVNLTIAMMHNDHEVRERENPFRPYLLARALYEGLRELMWDESHSKLLFDALGAAMARRLPGFYAGILTVFEEAGVHARLTARPTAMSRAERERPEWQSAARQLRNGANATSIAPGQAEGNTRLIEKLKRLKELQQSHDGLASRPSELTELLWNVFHLPRAGQGDAASRLVHGHKQGGARASAPAFPVEGFDKLHPSVRGAWAEAMQATGPQYSGSHGAALDAALAALQRDTAAGAASPAPLQLRDLLGHVQIDDQQRRTLDIAALLFEAIIHDELLGSSTRTHIGALYLPFVRAALTHPGVLTNEQNPVRRLIDRIGALAAGIPVDSAHFAVIDREVGKVVGAVLDLFDDDIHVFADAQAALDSHVAGVLCAADARVAACAEATAEAALASSRLSLVGAALSAALQPLQVDPRMADFILGTWARVLSHPADGVHAAVGLLPELLWSAQAKTTPEDRAAMTRMLPDLVRRVREGTASIALPEAPSKAAFDRLVAVHMDVLAHKQEAARRPMTLEQFKEHFRSFTIATPARAMTDDGWLGRFELEAALGRRGVELTLNGKAAARLTQGGDAALLAWAQPGMAFEIKAEDRYHHALLCAVEPGHRAFLFHMSAAGVPGQPQPLALYLKDPLLEALETGALRPYEYAPLFNRAIESLMTGAEALGG